MRRVGRRTFFLLSFFALTGYSQVPIPGVAAHFDDAKIKALCGQAKDAPAPVDDRTYAFRQLCEQIEIIDQLRPDVPDHLMGHVLVLRRAAQNVMEAIEKFKLAHKQTMYLYQVLIIKFRVPVHLFKAITNELNPDKIARLRLLADEIAKERGFDDSPYTKITRDVFTEIDGLLKQLLHSVSIPADLSKAIDNFQLPLHELISKGDVRGDRRLTLVSAIPVYRTLQAMYPKLTEIRRSASDLIDEIKGLGDWYADFDDIGLRELEQDKPLFALSLELARGSLEASRELASDGRDRDQLETLIKNMVTWQNSVNHPGAEPPLAERASFVTNGALYDRLSADPKTATFGKILQRLQPILK